MKKILLVMLSAVLLFMFSCKKDSNSVLTVSRVNVKKYAVKMGISSFTQTMGGISSVNRLMSSNRNLKCDSSLNGAIPFFYYIVYDAAGNEVDRIREDASAPGTGTRFLFTPDNNSSTGYDVNELPYYYTGKYGSVQDSLAAGTYTIVVFGSTRDNLLINYDGFDLDNTIPLPLNKAFAGYIHNLDPYPRSGDVLYKKLTVTVGNQGDSQNIKLDRIVGQVTVNIEDALPHDATFYELAINGEVLGFYLANGDLIGEVEPDFSADFKINKSDRGKANYQITQYVLNTVTPVTFKITVFDNNFNVLGTATIPNIQIHRNERTILSGKLFTPGSQFTITANQPWNNNLMTTH